MRSAARVSSTSYLSTPPSRSILRACISLRALLPLACREMVVAAEPSNLGWSCSETSAIALSILR
jgi:hypothetical protein